MEVNLFKLYLPEIKYYSLLQIVAFIRGWCLIK